MVGTYSEYPEPRTVVPAVEAAKSGVSWGAVFAGAAVAAAITLALMVLGAGFGLSIVSPWPGSGVSASTYAVTTAIGLVVIQWVSSGFGGYVTGRLRTRWVNVHTDEVAFRDTAHGFLTWCVATLFVAMVAGFISYGAASTGAQATATVASGAAQGAAAAAPAAAPADPTGYAIDMLFRPAPDTQPPAAANGDPRQEVARILANAVAAGGLPPADKTYLAQLVAQRTGLSQADAEKRVDEVVAQVDAAAVKAREAADAARKAGLWTAFAAFLALLIGAFIAAVSASLGGHLRDDPQTLR
ncbi:hypothetical protein FFK22_010725 [Mycobacterium sp. KBS0706]|uniref:hypothetical protein n=1 Tax=Mycobacterium sp. KBS0706 TaxID=2578109 RepID=UPI00110FC918|nr:hypothetical protein [Mycobacterium sp. KBS0706]TSD88743.1 hypothetical protein FFK22_010725 [Mycobacterium sp. KBS0706]